MSAFISILVSLTPFIFIIYYFRMIKTTKYISTDLQSGQRCYSCKQDIEIDSDELLDILVHNKTNYRLCKSCLRDEKLDNLINKSKLSRFHKLKLLLVSKEFDKISKILIVSMLFLLCIDISLNILFNVKWFSYFYNAFLACYWLIIIYKHKSISIKKPSE